MSDQPERWSPPADWHGDIEIEVRASGGGHTLRLTDATRQDWYGVEAALAEAAQRHAYGKAARERAKRRREGREGRPSPDAADTAEPEQPEDVPGDEPEAGETAPSTGHS
jgi:hypothetical protein